MINQQLLDYIKQQVRQGTSKEQIKNILMSNGWDASDVEEGFNAVSLQFPPIPHAPSPAPTINPTIQPTSNLVNPTVNQQAFVNQKKSKTWLKIVFVLFLVAILAGAGWFGYKYFFNSKVNSQAVTPPIVNQENNQTVLDQNPSQESFNTKPTKLIDLSLYDLEKSQKLWSEVSYFVFDGKGWFAQVPLVKKGETNSTIATGFANGSVLESPDGYSMVSSDGKYAITEHIQKVDGTTVSIQKKYSVKDIATGKVILETPLFADVRAIHFDNNSAFYIVVREQQNIVWYKNNVQIMKTGIPAGQSTQDTEAWIKRTIFFDKQNLAMAGTMDGKTKIMLNGNVITPDWKHPDDPILGIRILKSIADNKIFYVAIGKKNIAFFVNEKATMDNISFNENIVYLAPLFIGDADRLDYVADISSDGTRLAIVDTNGVTNSNIQQPVVRVLGKGSDVVRKVYPKGSRILEVKFSPDGNQLYYDAETDGNDVNKRKVYVVVNEVEQGPWKSVQEFHWSDNGMYIYVAMDEKNNTLIVKNGQTAVTQPWETWDNTPSYTEISQYSTNINPRNGKIFYVLDRIAHWETGVATETVIPLGDFQAYSTAVYDGVKSREFTGRVSGMDIGKSLFSPDGSHYVYLAGENGKIDDKKIIVIDGKEFPVEGTLLGSWSSRDGGFSADSKWFGVYVLKDNAVWWIPYNLEEIAKQQ